MDPYYIFRLLIQMSFYYLGCDYLFVKVLKGIANIEDVEDVGEIYLSRYIRTI